MSKIEAQERVRATLDGLKAFRWFSDHKFAVTVEPGERDREYQIKAWPLNDSIPAITATGQYLQDVILRLKNEAERKLVKAGLIKPTSIEDHFASLGG